MGKFLEFSLKSFGILAVFLVLQSVAFGDVSLVQNPADQPIEEPIDITELGKHLEADGIEGEVHGAAHDLGQYVFTYREPGNFFKYVEMNLLAGAADVGTVLKTLNRHDRIWIQGRFIKNPSAQPHALILKIRLVKKYESGLAVEPTPRNVKIPEDIRSLSALDAKVHAVAGDGGVLVVEYKDAVLPVFVQDTKWTKELYRNDLVRIHFKLMNRPRRPSHLVLDLTNPKPIEVLDRMVDWHGKQMTLEGSLVLFPKSPQVLFNVFALQIKNENGTTREFTLVNFDDHKVFEVIRLKLQEAWDKNAASAVDGRNKLLNPKVKVVATGTLNVVLPSQANPQILLESPEQIKLVVVP